MNVKLNLVKPKAVVFDTDNTLYEYGPAHKEATKAVEIKAKELLGVEIADFRDALTEAKKYIKELLGSTASSHSRLLYFQRTIEILGLKTQILFSLDLEQTYWRTFLTNCRLFPEVKEFVLDLKSKGIITANVTDLTAQIQFRKMVYFGLDEYFDFVVTSEESGADKPDTKPFMLAMNKMNMEPGNTWMIGDSLVADMSGADKLGMITLQKSHGGVELATKSDVQPDFVFRDYSELRKIINQE